MPAEKKILLRLFAALLVVQGAIAFVSLISIPGNSQGAVMGGMTRVRLLLACVPLGIVLIAGIFLIRSLRDERWVQAIAERLHQGLALNAAWGKIVLLYLLLILACLYVLSLNRGIIYTLTPPADTSQAFRAYETQQIFGRLMGYVLRLQPLEILLLGICAQTALLLPAFQLGIRAWVDQLKKHNVFLIGWIYALLVLVWRGIDWAWLNRLQENPFSTWYPLGTPITDLQVCVVVALALGAAIAAIHLRRYKTPQVTLINTSGLTSKLNLAIAFAIWGFAAYHWITTPQQANWFVAAPRYPNFQTYPNSDAYVYDTTAHNLLVGNGFKTVHRGYAIRPMHGFLLSILYRFTGIDYDAASLVQCAMLAIFPVIVYYITLLVHTRVSALIAAMLVILREGNAIALAGDIPVTNSKMLMVEMPVATGIALFILGAFLWHRLTRRRPLIALLLGCHLAIFLLIRPELGYFLVPSFIYMAVIAEWRLPRQFIKNLLAFGLGLFLFLSSWFWRAWIMDDRIYLERPERRLETLVPRSVSEGSVGVLPGSPPPSPSSPAQAAQNFLSGVITNYANSQLQALLIFPDAFHLADSLVRSIEAQDLSVFGQACCSRQNYIKRFVFWSSGKWIGALPVPSQSIVPISLNLFLIVAGIIRISRRKHPGGYFLLLVCIGFYLISSAVRVSGGRYVQIVDWMWIVFYAAGLGTCIQWAFNALHIGRLPDWLFNHDPGESALVSASQSRVGLSPRWYAGVGLGIFLLGTSLPLYESLTPPRYSEPAKQALLDELMQSPVLQREHPAIWDALQDIEGSHLRVFLGRALYPRYYAPGEGEPGVLPSPFTARDIGRVSFYLVGPTNAGIQLPMSKRPEITFPHGTDVLVVGCLAKEYREVNARVIFYKTPHTILASVPEPYPTICPLHRKDDDPIVQ